jgi:segregation and condensation protein A
MSQNDWLVRLPVFQGPLDLLLFLVRRAEVDIHEIEIRTLADQYLEYVRRLSSVDIDLAGEFLVMAATLVEIKSRSLAPAARPEGAEGDAAAAPGDDPRAELIRQLLAYQKFRTAGELLDARRREFAERAAARARPGAAEEPDEPEPDDFELEELHLGDLYAAFERIAASIDLTRVGDHRVEYDDTPISLHQSDLVDRLERAPEKRMTLQDVFTGKSRGEAIGLFLAMLELAREQKVGIRQDRINGTIEIELNLG